MGGRTYHTVTAMDRVDTKWNKRGGRRKRNKLHTGKQQAHKVHAHSMKSVMNNLLLQRSSQTGNTAQSMKLCTSHSCQSSRKFRVANPPSWLLRARKTKSVTDLSNTADVRILRERMRWVALRIFSDQRWTPHTYIHTAYRSA